MLWQLYTPLQNNAAMAASTALPPSCKTSLENYYCFINISINLLTLSLRLTAGGSKEPFF
jgi:hypothetical protein